MLKITPMQDTKKVKPPSKISSQILASSGLPHSSGIEPWIHSSIILDSIVILSKVDFILIDYIESQPAYAMITCSYILNQLNISHCWFDEIASYFDGRIIETKISIYHNHMLHYHPFRESIIASALYDVFMQKKTYHRARIKL